jgi:hypothetical protein
LMGTAGEADYEVLAALPRQRPMSCLMA